jgi:hypothetical protein
MPREKDNPAEDRVSKAILQFLIRRVIVLPIWRAGGMLGENRARPGAN